ncbi:MAG: phosphoglucosamine mutase, partial [Betaproteobacteria bacterium]
DSSALGRARRVDDAAGRYIEFCKATVPDSLSLGGLKVVVDAAHGAAYQVAPSVFHELGARVVRIGCAPDGRNINDGVGATAPQALAAAVREHGADLGVALDGDADRLQMVDQQGRLYNGDELLYLLAMDRLQSGLPVPGVVGTLMTNLGIELALRRAGVELVRAKVGDRYVLEALLERGWHLGGEGSGHLLVLDRHTTGDALVSALQVLQALRRQQRSLSQCLQDAELFPQKMINVRLQQATPWQATTAVDEAVKRVQAELGEGGRVLIRASGTEPVVRVMVEARDAQQADRCCQYLADVVAQR